MQHEHQTQIDRHPWNIKERGWTLTTPELAHGFQIADRVYVFAAVAHAQWYAQIGKERGARQTGINFLRNTRQATSTDAFQQGKEQIKDTGEAGDDHQCWHAVAGEHAIIDLQHEHRTRQHQQVDDQTQDPNARIPGPRRRKRLCHHRALWLPTLRCTHRYSRNHLAPNFSARHVLPTNDRTPVTLQNSWLCPNKNCGLHSM
ncbi:hypothetical protein PsAD13_02326 [Pseudovibrio sp. Ad13]|nr:hypothetical protein PsAD13_02326 [Pseudovibrio sp. Ad13]